MLSLIPIRGLYFAALLLSSLLPLVASAAATEKADPPVHTERVTREIDGVRFEFSPEHAAVVEVLAPRVAELNRDATAITTAVWTMPANEGPLSLRDFQENRDAWLTASARALGLAAPTPGQVECFDRYLQLINGFKVVAEGFIANARSNRIIRVITLWDKTELRQRLLAGEKVPGFTTTKEQDLVHFDWNIRGAPHLPETLAQRQLQLDALRLDYTFNATHGASGTTVSGRTTPHVSRAARSLGRARAGSGTGAISLCA